MHVLTNNHTGLPASHTFNPQTERAIPASASQPRLELPPGIIISGTAFGKGKVIYRRQKYRPT